MTQTKKILVIEDNEEISSILKERLEHDGFSVVVADDGYSALSFLKDKEGPDAVILDLMLPGRSGMDLLCSLKSKWPGTKIFIYSAFKEYKNKLDFYKEYISAFFCKSDGMENLINAIKSELSK
jgi:DNA-binding response OmpR family regulator